MSGCDDCADTGVKALYDSRGARWAVRCACGQRATAAWTAADGPARSSRSSAIYPPRDVPAGDPTDPRQGAQW